MRKSKRINHTPTEMSKFCVKHTQNTERREKHTYVKKIRVNLGFGCEEGDEIRATELRLRGSCQ